MMASLPANTPGRSRARPARGPRACGLRCWTHLFNLLGVGLLGCGGGPGATYAAAAIGLAAAVGGAAVNRSVTGGCWARCAPGFVCERSSGKCIRAECAPGCPVGTHCEKQLNNEFTCENDVGAFSFGTPSPHPSHPLNAADAGGIDGGGVATIQTTPDAQVTGDAEATPDAQVTREPTPTRQSPATWGAPTER